MPIADNATIARTFDAVTLSRAREYVKAGRVLEARERPNGVIVGQVQGTRAKPYYQEIRVEYKRDRWQINSSCTCPLLSDCKHVAAVLLELAPKGLTKPPPLDFPSPKAEALVPAVDPLVEGWLRDIADRMAPPRTYEPTATQHLLYVLRFKSSYTGSEFVVEFTNAPLKKDGTYGKTKRLGMQFVYGGTVPQMLLPSDEKLIRSIIRNLGGYTQDATVRLVGPEGSRHLEAILKTGRCVFDDVNSPPLQLGPARPGHLLWVERDDGSQVPLLAVEGAIALPTSPPWYLDRRNVQCGPVDVPVDAAVLEVILKAPPIRAEHSHRVKSTLSEILPDLPEVLPKVRKAPTIRQVAPRPVLTIARKLCRFEGTRVWRRPNQGPQERSLPIASLVFDYEGTHLKPTSSTGPYDEIRKVVGEEVIVIPRQRSMENEISATLLGLGWEFVHDVPDWRMPKGQSENFTIAPESLETVGESEQAFFEFLHQHVPALRREGWQIEGDFEIPEHESVVWQIEAHEDGPDWFGLNLGVLVDGERVDLRPLLLAALQAIGLSRRGLDQVPDEDNVYHQLPNGKILALPVGRLKPLLRALGEIFGSHTDWPDEMRLPNSRAADAALLAAATEEAGLAWTAPDRVRELSARLSSFESIAPVPSPAGFLGELRPYQSEGLAWLQFLREFGFGGILADDMGLGKTIQTLCHVLVEHEAGRLDRPCLIVAPKSTLPNWRREAERFAPSLRVLVLHGTDRKANFARLGEYDVVLTSYPLVSRDKEVLAKQEFHLVVLDEAQNIKNPVAAVTSAVSRLNARHRICLSGTPIENRLDELWSLLNFLMPGFLGSLTQFRQRFRGPIEQNGDVVARDRLSRRVRPFMLRRTKEQVATELPPKTEIIERVELTGTQRDLYESLRLAMDKRVRDLIASKGVNRSRIEILDALLKLRQVCNDPRLVKLEAAAKVQESAKLIRLVEMVDELLAEGRKILLFSQFTTMLDLIEVELKAAGHEWVRISGDTDDRDTPVRRFQAGEVPLFLISLRAGGTGLNLTAADTVIHYDPWWNPAVENQATDRAHRIGQEKAVFVYKLVALGTVEERILELQERKAKLASAIFGEDADAASALTPDDLQWIFTPDEKLV